MSHPESPARPRLPECTHPEKVWMPTVISRYSDPARGKMEHVLPLAYCEGCTKSITHEQLIPDYAWNAFLRAIRKQGHSPPPRHLNTIIWRRSNEAEKTMEWIRAHSIAHEDIREGD